MLELKDISLDYPGFRLGPLNLTLREGVSSLAGPNGSGKSTLLRIIAGLLPADSGEVSWFGKKLRTISARERAALFAYIPQHIPSRQGFVTREFVAMGRYRHNRYYYKSLDSMFEADPGARRTGKQASGEEGRASDSISQVLEDTELADKQYLPFSSLSGGEQRRACLAKALVQESRCLLLDEPAAFLDYAHHVRMAAILKRWSQKSGGSIIFISHDCGLHANLSDEVVALREGSLFATRTGEKFLEEDFLSRLYGTKFRVFQEAGNATPDYRITNGPIK